MPQILPAGSGGSIILPPAETDITDDGEGGEGKIEDAGVHSPGGFLPELLGGLGADGALGGSGAERCAQYKKYEPQYHQPLYHFRIFCKVKAVLFCNKICPLR